MQWRPKSTGEETNTNNMPYPALKCPSSPQTSAVPSLPVFTTRPTIPNPQMVPIHHLCGVPYRTVYLHDYACMWDLAVINVQAAVGGGGKDSTKTKSLITSLLTNGRVWLSTAGKVVHTRQLDQLQNSRETRYVPTFGWWADFNTTKN